MYGNQTRTTYRYDTATFRLTQLRTTRNNGDILQDLHYTFDPAGNITQIQEQAQPAVIFDLRDFFRARSLPAIIVYHPHGTAPDRSILTDQCF